MTDASLVPVPLDDVRAELLAHVEAFTSENASARQPCPDWQEELNTFRRAIVAAADHAALRAVTVELAPFIDSEWIVRPVIGGVWTVTTPTFWQAVATIKREAAGFALSRTPGGVLRYPHHFADDMDRGGFATLEAAVAWFRVFVQQDDCTIYETPGPWSQGTVAKNPRPGVVAEAVDAPRVIDGNRVLWASGSVAVLRTFEPAHPDYGDYNVAHGSPAGWTVIAADCATLGQAVAVAKGAD